MGAKIAGMGWTTAHGTDIAQVCALIRAGEPVVPHPAAHPVSGAEYLFARVPPECTRHLDRNPRLRRSGTISFLAVAAGLAALEDAGLASHAAPLARTAVIFAVSDGSVIHTRRFYEQLIRDGANRASPLLFPETVYNAPASHLAAQLGIDGASYTLVGDATVGLSALKMAEHLLQADAADWCVVVGCEEIDWILCAAYREWRLSASARCPERGAVLAEGAAALVLGHSGHTELHGIHDGVSIFRRSESEASIQRVIREVNGGEADGVFASANGTFIDAPEARALRAVCPEAAVYHPKRTVGEAIGASALMQVIAAAHACARGEARRALVPVLGWNQQASAALVVPAAPEALAS